MELDIVHLAIGLISGAVGGNVAGGLMKSNYGTMGRSIIGIVGGLGLSLVGSMTGLWGAADPTAGSSLSLMPILGNVVSGGVGGAILTAILGALKK